MASEDRLRELEQKYDGYTVYDRDGGKIGKVDDLFVDENDREEYIGVKMGLLGMSGTTLIPMEIVRVNEQDRAIEVSESKDHVKDAPHYNDDDDINQAFEQRIRSHFGLTGGASASGSYEQATGTGGTSTGDNTMRGSDQDTGGGSSRESVGREEYRNDENYVSNPAMGAAAGGAMGSGGMTETGDREGGAYREGSSRDEGQSGASMGSGTGGAQGDRYDEGYREGYQAAMRESGGQGGGPSGSSASGGDQGGRTGDREGASEHFGAPIAEPGAKEFNDMQDYQSATTGFQPARSEGSEGSEGEGRMRVRRLQR